jgi:hypothetical protein
MGVGFISEKRHPTARSWSLINGRLAARLATASARQSAKDRMPEGRRCERGQGRWPWFPVVFKNAGLRIDWLGHGRLARFRLIRNYGGCPGNSRKLPGNSFWGAVHTVTNFVTNFLITNFHEFHKSAARRPLGRAWRRPTNRLPGAAEELFQLAADF